MKITEPVTMLTDYLLAAQGIYVGCASWRQANLEKMRSVKFWSLAFFMLALGAFVGGTAHGFQLYLSDFLNAAIWKTTVYSIGLLSFFMLAGTAFASVGRRAQRFLTAAAFLQFFIFALWMLNHDDFIYVVYDYAPAMFGILVLQSIAYSNRKVMSAKWLIAGVLVSFLAAGIQVSGFAIHEHFNHNDLYHIVQMVAVYLLYRGVVLLRDVL